MSGVSFIQKKLSTNKFVKNIIQKSFPKKFIQIISTLYQRKKVFHITSSHHIQANTIVVSIDDVFDDNKIQECIIV